MIPRLLASEWSQINGHKQTKKIEHTSIAIKIQEDYISEQDQAPIWSYDAIFHSQTTNKMKISGKIQTS